MPVLSHTIVADPARMPRAHGCRRGVEHHEGDDDGAQPALSWSRIARNDMTAKLREHAARRCQRNSELRRGRVRDRAVQERPAG